jgi:hypothetical protein
VKDGLVSKESLFLTDMLEEILEKLPAMLRSVSAGSIQVFIPDPDPNFLPMPDQKSRVADPDPDSESGSGSGSRRAKMTPKSRIFFLKFMF